MFVSKSMPYISIFEIVQLILTIKFEIQITICKTNANDIFPHITSKQELWT